MSLASIVESPVERCAETSVDRASASAAVALADAAHEAHALGEHIAALAARLHAATYELLVLLAQFDERNGWNGGFLSCAHWLHWRTGIDLGAAREKVRVARALPLLPIVSAHMRRGALSYAKVRALTRVATPANEQALVDVALAGTASQLERVTRAWRRVDAARAARQDEARHLSRQLSTWVDDDGMVVVRGRLTPEVGAVLQRALEAAAEQLYRDGRGVAAGATLAEEVTPAQRRADALGLLAECALSAGLDAGTAGDRYQVVVHVEAAAHESAAQGRAGTGEGSDAGQGGQHRVQPCATGGTLELDHGALHVSAETSERLACDASVVVMRHDGEGRALDVGRRRRTIPPHIRRALAARDVTCRFPGCTSRRCDAHHVEHWAHGGVTRLDNLLLSCRRHHRAVHEGGFVVTSTTEGRWAFHGPDGQHVPNVPPAPLPAGTDECSVPASDITWDESLSIPVWDGTPLDVAWALDVLYAKGGQPGAMLPKWGP